MIAPVIAHVLCAALIATDLAARTWRVHLLAQTVGHPVQPLDALRVNLLADAGASLSPMRLAGEPARIAGLAVAGVSLRGSLALIACELATAWPTLLGIGVLTVAIAAPAWWSDTGVVLVQRGMAAMPALIVVALLSLGAWCVTAPLRRAVVRRLALPEPGAPWSLGRLPVGPLALSVLLSAANILTRTALLPVLVLTLPDPPSLAALWFGSFVLVYGQLVLPTPAGVGAVELGFLGGAAGAGAGDVGLLLAWRWWANGVPILLGLAVAWHLRTRIASVLRPARAT